MPLRTPTIGHQSRASTNTSRSPMSSFWRSCLEYFQRELTPQEFTSWIKPIRCTRSDDTVLLEVPNRLALRWIKDTYLARVQHLADEHFDTPMRITIE